MQQVCSGGVPHRYRGQSRRKRIWSAVNSEMNILLRDCQYLPEVIDLGIGKKSERREDGLGMHAE